MFEKLFMLVKNNAGMAVIDNPEIPEKYHDAVINEATSSIIDVLKGHMEMGRFKDLVRYFQFSGIYNPSVVSGITNKFANKLNTFYGISRDTAMKIADELIPAVMAELVEKSKNEKNKDFGLSHLLSKLTGNQHDMSALVNHVKLAL